MSQWTPDQIQSALGEKQKKLSETMALEPTIDKEFDEAEMAFEMLEAELSLLYELDEGGGRLSDPKIAFKVKADKKYQQAWADYIAAKSRKKRCKSDIKILEKEMKTLDSISMSMASEMKWLKTHEG